MPFMKLNTTAVTASQPPQRISAARVGSVRGARRVIANPATPHITAAGSSHATSAPIPDPEQPAPADVMVQIAQPTRLVAGQPTEPVVAQGQFDDAVVLRTPDIRARRRRPQLDERQIPPTGHHHGRGGAQHAGHPLTQRTMGGDQIGGGESGQDQESLQHLGEEAGSDRGARGGQPPTAGVFFAGSLHAVGGGDQHEHQQRVRIVEPEHQRGDRGQREHGAGQQRRARPADAADGSVEQADRGHTLQRLGRQHAPRVQPEQSDREVDDPQRRGGFVDGDRVGGVAGAEQHRRPAVRAGLCGRRVEAVRPPAGRQIPQIEHRGGSQQYADRDTVSGRRSVHSIDLHPDR